jgi:8-amino-7-oxononanoate synthase
MDLFKKCFEFTQASDAQKVGLYPYFHVLETKQDVEVVMEGKRRIMIGSNNYLGLTSHPEVIEAGVKALKDFGSGCSGSRFLNGTTSLHIELEDELAAFLNKPACMTMSTGFQTNLGIISAIAGKNDLVFCDKENHASIYDGIKLSYATMVRFNHSDMEDLESKLKAADPAKGKLIVTDGVFSMSGDICRLPEIVKLAKKYGAKTLVDDAHGLGILGKGGRGTAEYFNLEKEVDLIMGTFSKSLASLGGYMAGDKIVVDFVRHLARPFIFCASITPASVACARQALKILIREPQRPKKLLENAAFVRAGLTKRGIKIRGNSIVPIVPIYTYDYEKTLKATMNLYARGVFVNNVIPPATGPTECLLRTSYMSTHTFALLDEAMDTIQSVLKELEII